MKKILSILAVLALMLSISVLGVGTVASAAVESAAEDFFVYDGVLEEYVGEGGDVVIPASLGVVEIASRAFYENTDITSIVIPEGVKVIGSKAFFYCSNLVEVTLPYTLEELTEHEFSGCGITEIVIPGKLDVVSYGCFSSCFYLTELTISYGVEEILPLAFQGTSMEKVVFPETVELICGNGAFGNNKNAEATKMEYYICNPNCEIGSDVVGTVKAQKHEWTGVSSPWNHNKANPQYRIYVIEGSAVDKFLTEQGETLLHATDSGKGDSLKIYRESSQFFKDLPENQPTYGIQQPTNNTGATDGAGNTNGSGNAGTDGTGDSGNAGGDGNETGGNGNGGNAGGNGTSSNGANKNNSDGTTQTIITRSDDSSTLITVICIIGGVLLLVIIVVVILTATGVLFGKKGDDVEALKAKLEAAELKAKLTAMEEAAAKEAPAEQLPEAGENE